MRVMKNFTQTFRAKTIEEARRDFRWQHPHAKIITARRAMPGDRTSDVVITARRPVRRSS